jgi:serine protease Do
VAGFSQRGGFLSGSMCAPVVRQLILQGHVDRPRLGVVVRLVEANDPLRQLDPVLGQTPAIRIWKVLADSAAERAGLQTGDLILKLAGQPVGDTPSFAAAIAALHGPTEMQILRQDQTISVKVDLESQPSN